MNLYPTGANYTVLQKPLGLFLEKMIRLLNKICWCLKIIAYIPVIYLTGRHVSNIFRYPKDFKMKSLGAKHCLFCLFKTCLFSQLDMKVLLLLEQHLTSCMHWGGITDPIREFLAVPASQDCVNSWHAAGAGCVPMWVILLCFLLPWVPTDTGAVSLSLQHPCQGR